MPALMPDAMVSPAARLPEHLALWQSTLNWQPTAEQQQHFQQLYQEILIANQTLNLTRITQPEDFWEKHLWDSLCGIAPWLRSQPALQQSSPPLTKDDSRAGFQVIDIGTGGGFPGIPVAMVCPDWQMTLLDSTQKKMRFLATLIDTLGLGQVQGITARAEAIGHQPHHREQYDLVLIRAVGPVTTCAEYALPLLKVGGQAVLYRGQWSPDEAAALTDAAQQLGGQLAQVDPWQTPLSGGQRHCVWLQKVAPTVATFPRAVGIPGKLPLAVAKNL